MAGRIIRALTLALCASLCVLTAPAPAAAAKKKPHPNRVVVNVKSGAPDARRVKESWVNLRAPLPPEAGDHPAACDWISYLRFRDAGGPRNAKKADAIFVTMPGIFAGASSLDQFARNTVRRAHKRHRHVEVWTLDRRSNCLEDHYGNQVAARRHDAKIAFDYYYHGASVDGRTFGGFKSEEDPDAQFLKNVGLKQTVLDEYTVIKRNIPRRLRTKKVFCGGHSLGGPLTTAFANWDMDGNPDTTKDAGFRQCAGFFALDTRLNLGTPGSSSSGGGGQSPVGIALAANTASAGQPYVNAAPFTPETIQAIGPTGIAAFQQPRQESKVPQWLPDDPNFNATFRVLFSRDTANAITQMPNIRDFRVTNEVSLGAVFDDNSEPVTIVRASVGTFNGGAVAEKNFPSMYGSSGSLVDGKQLMIPIEPHGPLYTWWNYDKVGLPGTPTQLDDSGKPFTTRADEVTDLHQLARIMFEAPADFAEQYFPTHLLVDEESAGNGDRSGDLQDLRYDGIPKHPALYADAEHGIEEGADPPPKGPKPHAWIKLRGYNHIDVGTAAWKQNSGKREAETAAIVNWAMKVLGSRGRRILDQHR
jgi:hypothetical protein